MAERSLGVRETPGSIPGSPMKFHETPPWGPFRIALLYADEPSGHSESARAIESALLDAAPEGSSILRIGLAQRLYPAIGRALAWAHRSVLRAGPGAWERIFDSELLASAVRGAFAAVPAWAYWIRRR